MRVWRGVWYCSLSLPLEADGLLSSSGRRRVRADDRDSCDLWCVFLGSLIRRLLMDCATVWAVACLSNGDIAAGSSDGLVRVFTRADARVADLETVQVRFQIRRLI